MFYKKKPVPKNIQDCFYFSLVNFTVASLSFNVLVRRSERWSCTVLTKRQLYFRTQCFVKHKSKSCHITMHLGNFMCLFNYNADKNVPRAALTKYAYLQVTNKREEWSAFRCNHAKETKLAGVNSGSWAVQYSKTHTTCTCSNQDR